MSNKETSTDWRDVVSNKLHYGCRWFNENSRRVQPYLLVWSVLLFLWTGAVTPGLHYWVTQQRALATFLGHHDGWAYVYVIGQFLVVPTFFAAWLTYAAFRLGRAIQRQRQKRAS